MGKKKWTNDELKYTLIQEYKKFARRLGKTPTQADVKTERKLNNPNWVVTLHKISKYFNGMFELNEICGLKNYNKTKCKSKCKRTHEEFTDKVNTLVGNKFEFLTKYEGSDKDITIKCKKDDYVWKINANGFLSHGCKCPKCSNCVQNKDTDYFKKEVYEKHKNNYVVLGEYANAKTKILMQHNIKNCNHKFEVTPDSFLNKNTNCPLCSNKSRINKLTLTQEQFEKKVYDIFKNEYIVLGEYSGNKNKVKMKHIICGNDYYAQAGDVLQGKGCPICNKGVRKTQEQFKNEMLKIYGDEYSVIGEYINCKTDITIKHNVCGNISNLSPDNLLHKKTSCPHCSNITKGEFRIKRYLEYNKLNHKQQYKFNDLKDKDYLKFDDALLFNNDEVNLLIEYDGEQHFRPVRFGGISKSDASKNFKSAKRRDDLKNNYCKEKNIKLLRISYVDEKNIDIILQSYLDNVLHIKTKIPPNDFMFWEKNISILFIDLIKKLPNGIYPKKFIQKSLNTEMLICNILKNKNVLDYININNIIIEQNTITIINNYINYKDYFELISNYPLLYKDNIVKVIKILFDMPNGQFFKRNIKALNETFPHSIFPKKYFKNKFVEKFLLDNNILISNYYIRKGKNISDEWKKLKI